jgi:hypothetical protein
LAIKRRTESQQRGRSIYAWLSLNEGADWAGGCDLQADVRAAEAVLAGRCGAVSAFFAAAVQVKPPMFV